MLVRLALFMMSFAVLSACQAIVGDTGGGDVPPPENPNTVIQWERDRNYIIFRADVSPDPDPDRAFLLSGEIPFCTIYGDGTIVWTQETVSGAIKVLFGPVDDERIRYFVELLTVYRGFYNYGQELDLQMSESPPVAETLYLHVNGIPHTTDSFSDWSNDYFLDIVTLCKELSPQPQEYLPQGAWLRVREAPFDMNAPSILWEPSVTGIDLRAIADSGAPQWVSGRGLHLLWTYLGRSSPDLQFGQLDGNFIVSLQIPNITRSVPDTPPPNS